MIKQFKLGLILLLTATYTLATAEEKVLFVCTGNTGRSVMAEYYANYYAQKMHLDIMADSAGVDVDSKSTAPEGFAIEVMEQEGINIKDHTAQQVSRGIINSADLVLTMTTKQKNALLKIDPSAKNIYTLNECANGTNNDIEDAYGKPVNIYVETRDQIEADINKIYANDGKCLDN